MPITITPITVLGAEVSLGTFPINVITGSADIGSGIINYYFNDIAPPVFVGYQVTDVQDREYFIYENIQIYTVEYVFPNAFIDLQGNLRDVIQWSDIGENQLLTANNASLTYPCPKGNPFLSSYVAGSFSVGDRVYISRNPLGRSNAIYLTAEYFGKPINTVNIGKLNINHPCYRDLVGGYSLDSKTIPSEPTITSVVDATIKIQYYQENKLEPIPDLKSICWRVFTCDLKHDTPYRLPIKDCVLGTLYIDNASVLSQLMSLPTVSGCYSWASLLPESIPDLFNNWSILFNASNSNPTGAIIHPQTIKLHKLAANNNAWNNADLSSNIDIDFDITHPMFHVDDARAYDWHIKPVLEGVGSLLMDSPRIINIHAALEADKYAVNELDDTKPRYTSLGYYIEKIAWLLGHRLDANGDIDRNREQKLLTRKTLNNPTYEKNAYHTNSFGHWGYLFPHLTNDFSGNPYDVVYDIPQMLLALFEHINRSLGVQQGTKIELPNAVNGETDKYPNQLAMQLDGISKLTEINQNTREIYNLVTVASQEQRELFSGIGIPIVQKTMYTRYGSFPFIGHQQDKGSTNTSLTTIKSNIGILLGSQIQTPVNTKNPLERFIFGDSPN